MRDWIITFCICLFAASASRAAELKVATWNLNWLTTREAGLPPDVKVRPPEDFERLSAYSSELDAGIVAFQEVDGAQPARMLFPPDRYSVHLERDRVKQKVGIAVRLGLHYDVYPDVTALSPDPEAHLRAGVDIAVRLPPGPLRILAVHLKQGCDYARFGRSPGVVCQTLMGQFEVMSAWIAARREEGVAFLVMGDFNRILERPDPFVAKLRDAAPMIRATEGFSSPCWGQEAFIDHILIGGPARDWVKPGSMRVLSYRETDPAWKARLSDHCPVSVRLVVPD